MDDTASVIVILTPILSAGIYAYSWLKSRQQPMRHAARLAANTPVAPGCPVCRCRRIGNFCTKCGHAFKPEYAISVVRNWRMPRSGSETLDTEPPKTTAADLNRIADAIRDKDFQ